MAKATFYGFYKMPENSFKVTLPAFKHGETVKPSLEVGLRMEGTALLISKDSLEAYIGRALEVQDGMIKELDGRQYLNAYHIPVMSLIDGSASEYQCFFEAATHLEIIRRQLLGARQEPLRAAPIDL